MYNDNYKRNQNSSHRGGNKQNGKRSIPKVIPPRTFARESDVGKPSETGCTIPLNRMMWNKDSSEVSTLGDAEASTPRATSSPRASSQAASSEPEDRIGLRSHSQSEDDRLRGSSDENTQSGDSRFASVHGNLKGQRRNLSQSSNSSGMADESSCASESSLSSAMKPKQKPNKHESRNTGRLVTRAGSGPGWGMVEERARAIASEMAQGRMDNAVYAIQEIPDRVDALVQHVMSNLIEDVQQNVESACNAVREDLADSAGSDENLQEAIDNLEAIPEMVRKTFSNRKREIKQTVNQKINNVIHDIERNIDPLQRPQVGSKKQEDPLKVLLKLQRLPEDVAEAVERTQDAAQASRSAALYQLNCAVSHQLSTRQHHNLKQEMLQTIPEEWPQTIACAEAIAGQQVEQAMAQIMDANQNIPNQAVADAILKAKMKSNLQVGVSPTATSMTMGPCSTLKSGVSDVPDSHYDSDKSSSQLCVRNNVVDEADNCISAPCIRRAYSDSDLVPNLMTSCGSAGHPELCARACMYFWKGNCVSGRDCKFCHRPHPRRPPRFDKRHREELKKLTLPELKGMVTPILRKKARLFGFEAEIVQVLETIESIPEDTRNTGKGFGKKNEKDKKQQKRQIRGILEAMTVTTILRLVQNRLMDNEQTGGQGSSEFYSEFNKLMGLIDHLRGNSCANSSAGQGSTKKYKHRDPYGVSMF